MHVTAPHTPAQTSLELAPGCFLKRCSNASNFIPASFQITLPGKVIYIDPYHVNNTTPADFIFITHSHPDHLSRTDIRKIATSDTLIVCPQSSARALSSFHTRTVRPGDTFDLDGLQCEAVPAYNRWTPFHSRLFKYVGYILTLNGSRVYHAGDTDFIPEMKDIKGIAVALVPVGVGNFAMKPPQAAAAVNMIKPDRAVPMHYWRGRDNPERFKRLVDPGIEVVILEG